jgi:hypothetical protein
LPAGKPGNFSSIPHSPGIQRRPIYLLRLESLRGTDVRGLRALLKSLLRRFGFRCLSVEEVQR